MVNMDQGLSGGGGRKKPVTKAQMKKQQKAYQRADEIRTAKEKHHLGEELEAEKLLAQQLDEIDEAGPQG